MNITNKKLIFVVGGYALAILVLAGGFFGYRAFASSTDQNKWICTLMPWKKAAMVGPDAVSCRTFLAKRDLMARYFSSDLSKEMKREVEMTPTIEYRVLFDLMHDAAAKQMAAERSLPLVTDDDVTKAFDELVANAKNSTSTAMDVESQIKKAGWNADEFKNQIMKASMLDDRLIKSMSASSTQEQVSEYNALLGARLSKDDVKVYLNYPESVKGSNNLPAPSAP